ncbi:uncharacterized protein [Watersipora subatra]|uniref:uncharacterized protein isoform X2 n=1 Tax=Watersipora subatra TaxID=2589382 RepID=UPI00355B3972
MANTSSSLQEESYLNNTSSHDVDVSSQQTFLPSTRITSGTTNSARAITKSISSPNPLNLQASREAWNQRSFSLNQPTRHPYNVNPVLMGYSPVYPDYRQYLSSPYSPTPYHSFDQPAYSQGPLHHVNQRTKEILQASSQIEREMQPQRQTRFIRPALSPPTNHGEFHYPVDIADETKENSGSSLSPSAPTNQLAIELAKGLSSISTDHTKMASSNGTSVELEDTDSDEEEFTTHPNKFPVEIEYHDNKFCLYKRQPTRSGMKMKQVKASVYDPMTSETRNQLQQIKYYQKDLIRICRCGKYSEMDGALVQGRANDCDGYEIHYSQKCKWKAYDDYKTGQRVLIRLCKCYKPF